MILCVDTGRRRLWRHLTLTLSLRLRVRGPPEGDARVRGHAAQVVLVEALFRGQRLVGTRRLVVVGRMLLPLDGVVGETRCGGATRLLILAGVAVSAVHGLVVVGGGVVAVVRGRATVGRVVRVVGRVVVLFVGVGVVLLVVCFVTTVVLVSVVLGVCCYWWQRWLSM